VDFVDCAGNAVNGEGGFGMKYKLICYGCGKATDKGYHVLSDDTIYHYCLECIEDVEAVRENEEVQGIEKF